MVAKLEFMNPTGSFKDRGTATMLSVAMEHGVRLPWWRTRPATRGRPSQRMLREQASTAHVFAPATAPEAKMGQIRVYDAEHSPYSRSS